MAREAGARLVRRSFSESAWLRLAARAGVSVLMTIGCLKGGPWPNHFKTTYTGACLEPIIMCIELFGLSHSLARLSAEVAGRAVILWMACSFARIVFRTCSFCNVSAVAAAVNAALR